jgi:hypothetical protein
LRGLDAHVNRNGRKHRRVIRFFIGAIDQTGGFPIGVYAKDINTV